MSSWMSTPCLVRTCKPRLIFAFEKPNVVLIGDPAQLPPVCSTALYSLATSTQALVNNGEALKKLFTSHHADGDTKAGGGR